MPYFQKCSPVMWRSPNRSTRMPAALARRSLLVASAPAGEVAVRYAPQAVMNRARPRDRRRPRCHRQAEYPICERLGQRLCDRGNREYPAAVHADWYCAALSPPRPPRAAMNDRRSPFLDEDRRHMQQRGVETCPDMRCPLSCWRSAMDVDRSVRRPRSTRADFRRDDFSSAPLFGVAKSMLPPADPRNAFVDGDLDSSRVRPRN